jgi:bacillithiol biosynthesis cysteine-adding enzyme BshC
VARFFAGSPQDRTAWVEAIRNAQAHPRDCSAIAGAIERQQQRRDAPPRARTALAELRDSRTVAIVTGQQAGLFGGPLFTLLKALTAIRLTDELRATHKVPAVAVFWVDAEDHDWNEVRSCGVLDQELRPQTIGVGEPPGAHASAVARVVLDESVDEALTELARVLPQTDFTPETLAGLRRAYAPGVGMADAFARWLESLLGPRGLVVFDSSDPAAKPRVADLFAREVERRGETSSLARQVGSELEAAGYHAQVAPADGSLALFHLGGEREPIRIDGRDRFRVGDRSISSDELRAWVRRAPEEFSPSVLLRPLVQDSLFPTVCYVSGPSELAYLAQLKPVYAAFGIPMPLVRQRATFTLVDSNVMRFLTKSDIALERLRPRDDAALNALLEAQLPPGIEQSLDEASGAVEARLDALAASVVALDATLDGAVRSTRARMQEDLRKLHGKIIQAAKRKDDTLRRQFHHAQALTFPDGEPQERQIGFVYFLNKYGPTLFDRLHEMLPGEVGVHYVVAI